jgi:hypothetical protein
MKRLTSSFCIKNHPDKGGQAASLTLNGEVVTSER